MALSTFCRSEVKVFRAREVVERGATVFDWDHPEEITLTGCSVQFSETSGDAGQGRYSGGGQRQANATVRCRLYAPPGSDIKAGDKVVYKDVEYAIDGAPFEWDAGLGLDHVVCNLIDWQG